MSNPNQDDLHALIDQAASTVEKQEAKRSVPTRRPIFKPLMSIVLLALTIYVIASISARLTPPGSKEIARDLEIALEQARTAVEEAKNRTGKLPEALPNASLASVVRYEHQEDDYRLSTTIMGIRVTLEPDGRKHVEMGVKE